MAIPRNLANFAAFANAGSAGPTIQGLTAGRGGGAEISNTAFGLNALAANTTGALNTAVGRSALSQNNIGTINTALGDNALAQNTTGGSNTCIGYLSGYNVTTGSKNLSVYGGDGNVGNRLSAGSTNVVTLGTTDHEVFGFAPTAGTRLDGFTCGRGTGRVLTNVAFGFAALGSNTTGLGNIAIGSGSEATTGPLYANTTGQYNTALGHRTLQQNTTGNDNSCMGRSVGFSITTGSKNLGLYGGDNGGSSRFSAASVGIVSIGTADAERLLIETAAFKAQLVYDQTTGSAANVFVASDGKMSRSTSSQRYKKNIQDAVHGLEKVLQLRSVTFNHINPDEAGIVYGGLIAEEVHDLGLTEFVEYTWDGRPDSLRYGHMVSLLVKAVQELNARVVALEAQGA